MLPWFAWNHKGSIITGVSVFFVLIRFCIISPKTSKKNPGIILLSVLTYFAVNLRIFGITNVILFFSHISVFFFVIQMKNHEKEKLIRWTTTLYAWIIGISMIFYILIVFFGITFSYSLIKLDNEGGYPAFRNYKFLVMRDELTFFHRFQSIFLEPGHIGTIASLILYVNKYKLKKLSVFIILIGLLLSLSLAGYVLLMLGYCIYQIFDGNKIYKKIIIMLSIIILFGCVGLYLYNEYPDSIITKRIVNRLQYNEEKGISGNNRLTSRFDENYYTEYFLRTSNMIWGVDSEVYQQRFFLAGNSYKLFFLQYGFIGIVSLFLLYFSMSLHSRLLFGLFIVYCASFLQRTYALWEMELFLFVGARALFKQQNEQPRGKPRGIDKV
jgi:hypothetical protein